MIDITTSKRVKTATTKSKDNITTVTPREAITKTTKKSKKDVIVSCLMTRIPTVNTFLLLKRRANPRNLREKREDTWWKNLLVFLHSSKTATIAIIQINGCAGTMMTKNGNGEINMKMMAHPITLCSQVLKLMVYLKPQQAKILWSERFAPSHSWKNTAAIMWQKMISAQFTARNPKEATTFK